MSALAPSLSDFGVVSHISAAALYDWFDIDVYPSPVHLTDPRVSRSQTRRHIVRHGLHLPSSDIWRSGSTAVTSPARTALDIALALPFVSAVAALDSALKRSDVSRAAILVAVDASVGRRGREGARRALAFADPRSGSAAESFAHVQLFEMRAPPPELQRRLVTPGGRLAGIVDFFFAEQGVVLEIDGLSKYTDPEYLHGGTTAGAFIDEKRREHRLFECPEVKRIIRAGWRELRAVGTLQRMLEASGVAMGP